MARDVTYILQTSWAAAVEFIRDSVSVRSRGTKSASGSCSGEVLVMVSVSWCREFCTYEIRKRELQLQSLEVKTLDSDHHRWVRSGHACAGTGTGTESDNVDKRMASVG